MTQVDTVSSDIPSFTINDMFDAGVYFGRRVGARHPSMSQYIYGKSGGTHLFDLRKTAFALQRALKKAYESAKKGERIMFVSTNPRFSDLLKKVAEDSGQYHISKWHGGMLTNWKTIVSSIKTLKKFEEMLSDVKKQEDSGTLSYTKKEISKMHLERDKLHRSFGGIVDMGGMPDLVIVFSVKSETLAIRETRCVGTPVIGIADTDADPTGIEFPIPGNDDSWRSMRFYCDLFVQAILNGTKEWMRKGTIVSYNSDNESDADDSREDQQRPKFAKKKHVGKNGKKVVRRSDANVAMDASNAEGTDNTSTLESEKSDEVVANVEESNASE